MPYRLFKKKGDEPDFSGYLDKPHELIECGRGIFRSPEGLAAAIFYDGSKEDGDSVVLLVDQALLNEDGLKVFQPFEASTCWNAVRPPRNKVPEWSFVFAANRETKEDLLKSSIKAGCLIVSFDERDFIFEEQVPVWVHDPSGRFRKGDTIPLRDGRSLLVMGVS